MKRNSHREAAVQSENVSHPTSLRIPRWKPWARRLSNAPRYQRRRWSHNIFVVGIRSVAALHDRGAIVMYPFTLRASDSS